MKSERVESKGRKGSERASSEMVEREREGSELTLHATGSSTSDESVPSSFGDGESFSVGESNWVRRKEEERG